MAKTEQVQEFTALLELVTKKWGKLIAEGAVAPTELTKQLDMLCKLGKLTTARLRSVIMGRFMEANPDWGKAKTKKAPDTEAYAVFQDDQRHTCIRIAVSNKMVSFIPMASELLVYDLSNYEFEKLYATQLTDYPVKKAAQLYLEAKWLNSSPLAKQHLNFICGNTFTDPVKGEHQEEPTMATAANTAAPAKKAPPAKAPAKAPAVKAAPAKAAPAKAPAAKAAPAKASAAKAESKENKFAGKKITVLNKEHGRREGTWSHFMNDTAVKSKTTDEAQSKVDASEYKGKTMDWRYLTAQKIVSLS